MSEFKVYPEEEALLKAIQDIVRGWIRLVPELQQVEWGRLTALQFRMEGDREAALRILQYLREGK